MPRGLRLAWRAVGLPIVALCLLSAPLLLEVRAQGVIPDRQTYRSDANGFTVDYPGDWRRDEGGECVRYTTPQPAEVCPVVTFFGEEGHAIFRVHVGDWSAVPLTLEELSDVFASAYTDLPRQRAAGLDEVRILRYQASELAGLPGALIEIETRAMNTGALVVLLQRWALREGKLYMVTFVGADGLYDDTLPIAEAMISSFRLR